MSLRSVLVFKIEKLWDRFEELIGEISDLLGNSNRDNSKLINLAQELENILTTLCEDHNDHEACKILDIFYDVVGNLDDLDEDIVDTALQNFLVTLNETEEE